ncbi:hypothetical protein [Picosynechococcus sp. NKBG15041c]|uniref:hypothetical protein n=1 Tax=Picosynechococcus sp. NKBG15041c TaxID=1407650 RepID=UPI00042808A9|nr:hypothetical protein [Picosynechococcus sp. NKBG15041c]
MVPTIISFVIGCAVGAGGFYLAKKDDLNRLSTLETELSQLRRDLQNSETQHEQRLREAIAQLEKDYQGKITSLEAKLVSPEPAPQELSAPAIPVAVTLPDTMEPPILAAEIKCGDRPTLTLSNPSGQACVPPILAQGITATPAVTVTVTFEPPILAADIRCRAGAPTLNLATPSGKICVPPILAQA